MGTDNCEATNITPTDDIHVQFRATNSVGITTGGITTYIYDNTAPTIPVAISPVNGTLNESHISLERAPSNDGGIGVGGYYYQISNDS